MFLILTRAANETEENVDRILEEAHRQFPGIHEKQIIAVDSKAQLFYNRVQDNTVEEIQTILKDQVKELELFIKFAWYDANGNRERFLQKLREISNFDVVDDALNLFAHAAHYLVLIEFLEDMQKAIKKICATLDEKIDIYEQQAKDPIELAHRLNVAKRNLEDITQKLYYGVDAIADKYGKTGGVIDKKANEEFEEYKKEIDGLRSSDPRSMDKLEEISFDKINRFTVFEGELQKNIETECNAALIALSDKSGIKYATLKPDLTKESFEKIKKDIKNSDAAMESYTYTTGRTFEKTHTGTRFSKDKYFKAVRDNIQGRIDSIKKQAVADLKSFVSGITTVYSSELNKNAQIKRAEYDAIVQEQNTEEEIQEKIGNLKDLRDQLTPVGDRVQALKGGIEGNVR
jgi:hypothetical protein